MKALMMQTYNPANIVEIVKVDKELIETAKRKPTRMSSFTDEQYDVDQTLFYEDGLKFKETSRQKNERLDSKQEIIINLKEGDILIKTELGYKVNMLPIKIITDKEERLIQKYNQLGK